MAVTMPCFGTTDRTYNNACTLVHKLGATLKEVDIRPAVNQHFKDIEHDPEVHDVTYENSTGKRAYTGANGYCQPEQWYGNWYR